jgi:internalin A
MDLHDEDLYQLRYMPNLTWLDLSYNPITDLTPLAGLVNLRTLHMKGNPIRDWTPVSHVDVVLGRPD